MFKVGEIVVYPRQGAGKVVARERRQLLGEEHEYLTIQIFQSELTMLVRCDGVEAAGIRPVVAKQALQEIIEVLTGDVGEQDANWNRRFRAHQEQLKSSDPRELAGVIRNLARRQDVVMVTINHRLNTFGFTYIEGGWPGSNPKDVEFLPRPSR